MYSDCNIVLKSIMPLKLFLTDVKMYTQCITRYINKWKKNSKIEILSNFLVIIG